MRIDYEKLDRLRANHATLHTTYTTTAQRALDEGREAARLRVEVHATSRSDGAGTRVAAMSVEELGSLSEAELDDSGISSRLVRRLVDTERRASATRADAADIADHHRRSRVLLDRIEQFVQQIPEGQA